MMNSTGNRIAVLLLGLGPVLPGLADLPHDDADRLWVTRDGRHLRLGEMTTEHLRNAAAMLTQDAARWRTSAGGDDPHYAVRREDLAAAMNRLIAARSARPIRRSWLARRA